MRRRFRGKGFLPRAKKPVRWTGDASLGIQTLAGNTVATADLASATDYDLTGTLEQGNVTCLRTRGTLVFGPSAGVQSIVTAAIYVMDTSAGVAVLNSLYDPTTFAQFIRGDLIWITKRMIGVASFDPIWVDFDIKRKAKLETDRVVLVVRNETANAIAWGYEARVLLSGT